ncbi:tetratricopeptide repeat protein [Amycolatopsis anabasis]|uniref:tetratricopeptide repeat protein n=1 Tax=Amycolatopsis anabasis TaxID=1840409 RepID=UPI00131C7FE1|nr:tetratricopeptide repeat protein [Amycolatopsis anabasis]
MGPGDIRYSVLGPVTAWHADQKIELGWAKQQAVLAVLLLELNRPVPARRIVDAVWGDHVPRDARNAVQTYISRLRRVLRDGGEPGEREPALVSTKAGYLLRGDPAKLDVAEFERHVDAAAKHHRAGDLAAAAGEAEAALALWHGEPFGGLAGPLLEAERRRLHERRLTALELRFTADLDRGRATESVAELTRLVDGYPLQERFRALLMRALWQSGRQAAALEVFRDARRRLAEELGVDPGEELRQLHERILRGDAEPRPEPAPRRDTLPHDVTDFTGREAELDRLLTAVSGARSATATVIQAIDGPAGVGKTALAVHAAHRLAEAYPDARLYLDLQGHTEDDQPVDPMDALDTLLRALGVPGERIPNEPATRTALWRAELAGRRALVVLDNAACANQVRPLLPGTARCVALVTSRRRMVDLEGAHTLSLDGLPHADAADLFATIVDDGRITAEPEALDEVVDLCGRLPLAIRIAAARLRTRPAWTLRYLTDRLRQGCGRLTELAAGDRSVPAAFDLSYRNLTGAQQRLFRLLGLVPGPNFDAHAAAALTGCAREDAESLLEALVDVHMLQQPEPGRYRFHDLLRHYAGDKAQQDESESACRTALGRLLDYYLHTAAAAVNTLSPHEENRWPELPDPAPLTAYDQALAWLDAERPNLLAAAARVADHDRHAHAWRQSSILGHYLHLRYRVADAVTLDTHALAAARGLGDRIGEGQALHRLGYDCYRLDQYEQARLHYERALAIFREIGDHGLEGDVLRDLGVVYAEFGRYADAIDVNRRALTIARDMEDRGSAGDALSNLGIVYERLGNHADSVEHHRQALAIAREIGHRPGECFTLCELGVTRRHLGQYREALEHHRRALAIAREIGHRANEGFVLCRIGEIHESLGRYAEALELHRRALAIAVDIGHRTGEGHVLSNVGFVLERLGRYAEALEHHQRALAIARDIGNRADECCALGGLGTDSMRLGRLPDAREHHSRALAIAREIGYRARESDALSGLGSVHEAQGDFADAVERHEAALELAREIGYRAGEGRALDGLGSVRHRLGRYEEARAWHRRALAVARETGDRGQQARAHHGLGDAHHGLGHRPRARRHWRLALTVYTAIGAPAADEVRERLRLS